MSHPHAPGRDSPSRWQTLVFHAKTRVLQVRRAIVELKTLPPLHLPDMCLADAPVTAGKRAPLWRELTPEEFPLTAGKVKNLRRAARAFHGVEIPAGAVGKSLTTNGRHQREHKSGTQPPPRCCSRSARGIPVIATAACGLPEHDLLYEHSLRPIPPR